MAPSSNASSFDAADDQDLGDWVDDTGGEASSNLNYAGVTDFNASDPTQFRALFADEGVKGQLRSFKTAAEAFDDSKKKGCDLVAVVRRLALDPLQVIRLLNYTRRAALSGNSSVTPASIANLQGDEAFLSDDAELVPVEGCEMDGLLQVDFDELEDGAELTGSEAASKAATARIAELESALQASQLAFEDLRSRYTSSKGIEQDDDEAAPSAGPSSSATASGAKKVAPARDDDSHYFSSYAGHDIHQTMLSDKVRTLSYAKFLLHPRNASLLRGKVVMDIGCGSGILSMLAARAGAKEVLAIDASAIAHKAEANIRDNGLQHVVRVVKGKIEELDATLEAYVGKVDLIVSEWMGYFLLYESMLPSVLHARERYLAPNGVLAPSHCRMTLAALSDEALVQLRLKFWDDVYGFTMPSMGKGLDDEAWSEGVSADKVVSDVATIYDLPLQIMSVRQPTFVSDFKLTCTKDTQVHALISWFDTWFTPDGQPFPSGGRTECAGGEELIGLPACESRCPEENEIRGLDLKSGAIVDVESDEKGGETVSFTTGPHGLETHWKQTLFVLKAPIEAAKGTIISGTIHVTVASDNSRELDVEMHYAVQRAGEAAPAQKTVQLFAVR